MKLYAVKPSGEFTEYAEQSFSESYREKTIESWLESNPAAILEDSGLLFIGRQVTTDLGASIDLLAIDRNGDVAVVELKRDRTPRDVIAQALEYAAFAAALDYEALEAISQAYSGDEGVSLAEAHRAYFGRDESEAVSFNKDQRIVIVGSAITPPVRQTATFLRRKGVRVTCLEFGYFRTAAGEQLLSTDLVVGQESPAQHRPSTATQPRTSKAAFLAACDDAGRALFVPLLAMAEEHGYPINWGSKGFSLNAPLQGGAKGWVCLGYPQPERGAQRAPSLLVSFREIEKAPPSAQALVSSLSSRFMSTGLFAVAGSYGSLRYWITKRPTDEQVRQIVELVHELAEAVKALDRGDTSDSSE